jgi:hypothetical protein
MMTPRRLNSSEGREYSVSDFHAVSGPEPFEDVVQMCAHRWLFEVKSLHDFFVSEAADDQIDDFRLSLGKLQSLRNPLPFSGAE